MTKSSSIDLRTLSDTEVGLWLAKRLKTWRIDPKGAGLSASELSRRSGMGLTPLRRFEKTGGITLRNLIGLLRAQGLLDRLQELVPEPAGPSPMELLEAQRAVRPRQRAPRSRAPAPPSA
jgi:hypothetical protein